MIRPPGWDGVAFTDASDGDMRGDPVARMDVSRRLGIDSEWVRVRQVHGDMVRRAEEPGEAGEADAVWTTERALPLAIFTADCFGVVLMASRAVGVAHAGWRGTAAGVVGKLRSGMTAGGHHPDRAAVGPGIGPCCFEVGPEVAAEFQEHTAMTSWDTVSVDLPGALARELDGLRTWWTARCTMHEDVFHSHRATGTPARQVSLGWIE